tara:strand:+ start:3057 stop:3242 length:186 start_codon:yes stop_codon:yes gene_type:complete
MAATQTQPTTETYKGHDLIVLNPDADKFKQFKFGLAKAKLVIEHLDAVQSFIEESEGKASA